VSKPKNSVPSVTVTFTTTPQVKSLLAKLVEGGLYGKNAAEAAERLIARALEQMVAGGALKAPAPQPSSDMGGRTSSGAGRLAGSSD
jgi:hypothetical protein